MADIPTLLSQMEASVNALIAKVNATSIAHADIEALVRKSVLIVDNQSISGIKTFAQTIQGNAATASKLQTARRLSLAGDLSGSCLFNGGSDVSINVSLAPNGVTSGTYGANASLVLSHGGKLTVPTVTVDSAGRVTGISDTVLTLPSLSSTKISFARALTSGVQIGTLTINGVSTDLFCVPNTDTTYAFKDPLSVTGTDVSLKVSGVTSGAYGQKQDITLSGGDSFSVPYFSVDKWGRVTQASTSRLTLPTTLSYSLPIATGAILGGVKIGANITEAADGKISVTKSNVLSALGYTPPTQDTTYSVVSSNANGLMTSADKLKLDKLKVDSYISGPAWANAQRVAKNTQKTAATNAFVFTQPGRDYSGTGITINGTWYELFAINNDYWKQRAACMITLQKGDKYKADCDTFYIPCS